MSQSKYLNASAENLAALSKMSYQLANEHFSGKQPSNDPNISFSLPPLMCYVFPLQSELPVSPPGESFRKNTTKGTHICIAADKAGEFLAAVSSLGLKPWPCRTADCACCLPADHPYTCSVSLSFPLPLIQSKQGYLGFKPLLVSELSKQLESMGSPTMGISASKFVPSSRTKEATLVAYLLFQSDAARTRFNNSQQEFRKALEARSYRFILARDGYHSYQQLNTCGLATNRTMNLFAPSIQRIAPSLLTYIFQNLSTRRIFKCYCRKQIWTKSHITLVPTPCPPKRAHSPYYLSLSRTTALSTI